MKSLIGTMFLIAALAGGQSAPAAEVMRCNNLQMVVYKEDGSATIKPAGVSIVISTSKAGKYGWIAELVQRRSSSVEKDVKVGNIAPQSEDGGEVKAMAGMIAPHIDWNDVVAIRYGNVGVKANEQDAAGMTIFELLGKQGRLLGKIARIGWGMGVCVTNPR